MFSTLRTRFGIPGVISVIALVFAMFGGAYAASNSSGGGKATASAKAKKGPRGPKGATGPAGPQGPAGPAGAKGDAGAAGANGKDGTNGTNGTNGTSAEATSFAGAKGSCTEGGIEVKSAKPAALVCNGVKGTNGTTGFTETLPSGKTETGTWNVTVIGASMTTSPAALGSVSFPIPLASTGETFVFTKAQTAAQEFGASGCTGSLEAPTAPPGKLCVYTRDEQRTNVEGELRAKQPGEGAPESRFGSSGAILYGLAIEGSAEEPARAIFSGSWAVTAP